MVAFPRHLGGGSSGSGGHPDHQWNLALVTDSGGKVVLSWMPTTFKGLLLKLIFIPCIILNDFAYILIFNGKLPLLWHSLHMCCPIIAWLSIAVVFIHSSYLGAWCFRMLFESLIPVIMQLYVGSEWCEKGT